MYYENITRPSVSGMTESSIMGSVKGTDYEGDLIFENLKAEKFLAGGSYVLVADGTGNRTCRHFLAEVGLLTFVKSMANNDVARVLWQARVLAIEGGMATVELYAACGADQYIETVEGIPVTVAYGANFCGPWDITVQNGASVTTKVPMNFIH